MSHFLNQFKKEALAIPDLCGHSYDMKTTTTTLSQAFLRLALSVSYLSAVADRFGLWGAPGTPGVSWGNWQNFVAYSNSVNSFVPPFLGNVLAIVATTLEVILPALLLIGYKIRLASMASGIVLLLFALAMTISFGMKAPLDYSVWTGAAASFLLSALPTHPYSLDQAIASNR
jgi:uncharacterized membrane protein YphA (DoxX/SURF4 family)